MNIAKLRKFLMEWVLPPRGIRIVCYLMSRLLPSRSTIGRHVRHSDQLFVMGNGPSLTKDLERYGEEMMAHDRLVVNFMGASDLYEKLKPNVCVFLDDAFFVDPETLTKDMRDKVSRLVSALVEKTAWSLEIAVPEGAKDSHFVTRVLQNKNITVLCFGFTVPMPMDSEDMSGWLRNLHAAPGQNVLTTSIYLGIFWRYSKVWVLGADMSFHSQMRVEQDTNRLYIEDAHYYGSQRRYMYCDARQTISRRMSSAMQEYMIVFSWFEKLRRLADYAGVKVVNASSFSWIDAFERPEPVGANE